MTLFPSIREKYIKSPLLYPGSKAGFIKVIDYHIPKNITEIASPFLGGGSLELFLASKGIKVYASDALSELINFWNTLKENPYDLIEKINSHFPMTKDKYDSFENSLSNTSQVNLEMASIYYVFNRCSFSGIGGWVGGIKYKEHTEVENRFTKERVSLLKKLNLENITFENLDFVDALEKHKDKFLFLDPPYFNEHGNIYSKKWTGLKSFRDRHYELKSLLSLRRRWIMTYDNCEEILDMYKDYEILKLHKGYSLKGSKLQNKNTKRKENQLLILNI